VSPVRMHVHGLVTEHWAWRGRHREHLFCCQNVSIDPLRSTEHGADHIENTSSNSFSIVASACFGRCLEIDLYVAIYFTILLVFYEGFLRLPIRRLL
jgi:hypothetical protein